MTRLNPFTYCRLDLGGIYRYPTQGGRGEGLHAATYSDTTTVFLGYDSRCGWCWLNAGHTAAAHEAKLTPERHT